MPVLLLFYGVIKTNVPKISCLLVTAPGRLDFARRSIQCYVDQTYPHKELVIVNEGPKEYQKALTDHVQSLERTDIRCVWLNGQYTLGALRNISVGLSDGELFCQWDDDDFSTPQRLASQYAYLATKPIQRVCYLSDQLQYFFHDNTLYWNDWSSFGSGGNKRYAVIPGTIMAYKHVWSDWKLRYPSVGKWCKAGEDSVLSDQIIKVAEKGLALLKGMGYMHVYSHHGVNQVYNYEHHKGIAVARSHYRNMIVKNKNQISRSLDYFNFAPEVKVMCRDGLVYIHRSKDVQGS